MEIRASVSVKTFANKRLDFLKAYTVEPRYFEPSGEAKNSSKYREFEMANSTWLKGKSKGNGF